MLYNYLITLLVWLFDYLFLRKYPIYSVQLIEVSVSDAYMYTMKTAVVSLNQEINREVVEFQALFMFSAFQLL